MGYAAHNVALASKGYPPKPPDVAASAHRCNASDNLVIHRLPHNINQIFFKHWHERNKLGRAARDHTWMIAHVLSVGVARWPLEPLQILFELLPSKVVLFELRDASLALMNGNTIDQVAVHPVPREARHKIKVQVFVLEGSIRLKLPTEHHFCLM
eukprot:6334067-Pyramimonas_sp.AAC.1